MYPPFVTQKVEPKCAATDAAEREQRASLACTMPSREEENFVKAKFVGSPLVVGKTDATHF